MTTFLLGFLCAFLLFVGFDVLMIYRMRDEAAQALMDAREQRRKIEAEAEAWRASYRPPPVVAEFYRGVERMKERCPESKAKGETDPG